MNLEAKNLLYYPTTPTKERYKNEELTASRNFAIPSYRPQLEFAHVPIMLIEMICLFLHYSNSIYHIYFWWTTALFVF